MRGQTTYTFKRIEKVQKKRRRRDETLPNCAACGGEIGRIVYRNNFYDPLCRVCFETPDIREKDYLVERKMQRQQQNKPQSKPQEPQETQIIIQDCPDKETCKHASDVSKTCNSHRKAYENCRFFHKNGYGE